MSYEFTYGYCAEGTPVVDSFRSLSEEHFNDQGAGHWVDVPSSDNDVVFLPGVFTRRTAITAVNAWYQSVQNGRGPFSVAARLHDESNLTRRVHEMLVPFDGADCGNYGPTHDFISSYVTDALSSTDIRQPDEFFEMWDYAQNDDHCADVRLNTRIVVESPKEKVVTKYFVVQDCDYIDWKEGFTSLKRAKEWAVQFLESGMGDSEGLDYKIQAVTRRKSGADIATVKRVIVNGVVRVKVVFAKPSDPSPHGGWFIGARCYR